MIKFPFPIKLTAYCEVIPKAEKEKYLEAERLLKETEDNQKES